MTRLLLGAAAGVLQFLAFPPVGWWWTAPVAVALFILAVREAPPGRAAGLGLISGWAFFLPLLHWITVVGWDGWLALAMVISGWYAFMGWATNLVLRLRWWPLAGPAVWVLQEWLRSRFPWGGLGWGRLAFGQPDSPLTGWVTLGGAPLLSFVVALTGCLIVWAWTSGRAAAASVAALAALILVGSTTYPAPSTTQSPGDSQLAVIQGNVPQPGLDFMGRPLAVLGNHQRTTAELAAAVQAGAEPAPDGVIWPENSADLDPVQRSDARALVESAADSIDAPILVGTLQEVPGRPDHVANVGLVWDPVLGPVDVYVKQHPVPFGEYLPLRSLLAPLISRFDRVPRDFIAGSEPGVLQLGPARIGSVICFEISSDEIVRTSVRAGGRVVVVQTNNATYAQTAQPEQQFEISRLRARETGRQVLVAATTGVTAVIAPDGTATTLPQLQPGWINAEVALYDSWTPAVRFGGLVDAVLSLLGAVAVVAGMWVRRRPARTDG